MNFPAKQVTKGEKEIIGLRELIKFLWILIAFLMKLCMKTWRKL